MSQQQKRKKIAIIAAIAGIMVAVLVAAYFAPLRSEITIIPVTETEQEVSDAYGIVHGYVVSSPTFAYDGDIDTLIIEYVGSTKSIPPQHMFKASFDSSQGGFGNREGQFLIQVITPHVMDVMVSEGMVISAVTDDTWDEMNHQYVLKKPQPKLPSHDEQIVPYDGKVTDYVSLLAAIKAQGILVEQVEEIGDSPFSVPTKVISVGGADVQVFEFQSESDAHAASLTVSKDGTEIGTSIIRWIDVPHFYANGKIIVLYVGQNPEIEGLFKSLFGTQFAGM